jgi:hypothetical protein
MIRLTMISLGALALRGCSTGCRRDSEEVSRTLGFDEFVPVYNRHIANWLKTQQEAHREGGAASRPNSPTPMRPNAARS